MKKYFLFFLSFMLLSFGGFAQLKKGNKILGGTLNYYNSMSNSDNIGTTGGTSRKTNRFSISPTFGVFVSDRTVVGMKFDFFSNLTEDNPLTGQTLSIENDRIGFGPYVRRYFPVKEWVAFYGQADMGYSYGKIKHTESSPSTQNNELSTKTIYLTSSLGLAFFPTNWMSVDLFINPISFTHLINQNNGEGSNISEGNTNTFSFNLTSNSFYLGAHFFLNKK